MMEEMPDFAREEEGKLLEELFGLQESIMDAILTKPGVDDGDVTLEIKHAAGGSESSLFALDLLGMYKEYCKANGWRV